MEFIQSFGEEPAAPGPAVDPVDDLLDHKEDLVFGLHRQQFPADLRVPPAPSPDRDEVMAVLGLQEVEGAGLDADAALDTLLIVQSPKSRS